MRPEFVIPLLLLIAVPGFTQSPGPDARAASEAADQASWAEWEAQSRAIDGDYDGAVQAERQADTERQGVERRPLIRRSPEP